MILILWDCESAEGVKGDFHEACLEVEMRACGVAAVSAQGYGLPCHDVLSGGDQWAGQMGLSGLETPVVDKGHVVAVASGLAVDTLDCAREGGSDSVADSHRDIYSPMRSA